MDGIHPHFFGLLLLLLRTSTTEAQLCSASQVITFPENNAVGDVVTTITIQEGVKLTIVSIEPPDNQFVLQENQLIAMKVLDYEATPNIDVVIRCALESGQTSPPLHIVILLENENDNPPVFDQDVYNDRINEMSPVDTTVGSYVAKDRDQLPIYYRLTTESSFFRLKLPSVPEILVNARLDYDKVKEVQLVLEAQDTPLDSGPGEVSFTATTTIIISIVDVDNRPPWFQPCTNYEIGGVLVCESPIYTGRVVLGKQVTGVLPLKPGPLYAVDGDSGINEAINYSFLNGNEGDLFEINSDTGNITMRKPTDVVGTINLRVLAAQRINTHQFASTDVRISVQEESLHRPEFEKLQYDAVVTSVGSVAVDPNDNKALTIWAKDKDYAATGEINPHITYSVEENGNFSIVGGFLFMIKEQPEGRLNLQILAKDTSNDETATAQVRVEVKLGSSTTSLPLSTTDIITTTLVVESTTNSKTTNKIKSTTEPTLSTSISTTSSSITTEGGSSPVTVQPVVPSGEFGVVDMAALGATLGVLLFLCLVIIGVLVYRMQRGKTDWKKIHEATMFRNSLGQGSEGKKEGMQYTNEAFQKDDDGGSIGSGGPEGRSITARGDQTETAWNIPPKVVNQESLARLHSLLPDNTSDTGLDKGDDEKEVKPILTKERRVEEGYKSVWFKEDIDPNAKEEVVIIPDSRKDDSEDEDDLEPSSSGKMVHENDISPRKVPKVGFVDTDLDSGLGVKMDDPAEDSESDKVLNIDL